MKKYINKYTSFVSGVIAALLFAVIPAHASAATVYVNASRTTVSVGDTAVISVMVDTDGDTLNTVDGSVVFSRPGLAVQEFSLAHSAFGLWPQTPSLSTGGLSVSFVGGVPGGFDIQGATLFEIVVQATSTGTITVSPENTKVYANDGTGNTVSTQLKNVTITVVPAKAGVAPVNDWAAIISNDKTPPEPFIIVPGQNANIFDGKKFVFFSAVDNQSGVAYYEVSEDGGVPVRSGSTYVPQDQGNNLMLSVTAYDMAGNSRTETYSAAASSSASSSIGSGANTGSNLNKIIIAIGVLLVVIIAVIVGILLNKKSKKNKQNVPNKPQ